MNFESTASTISPLGPAQAVGREGAHFSYGARFVNAAIWEGKDLITKSTKDAKRAALPDERARGENCLMVRQRDPSRASEFHFRRGHPRRDGRRKAC